MKNPKVKIVQKATGRWQIEAENGNVLVANLTLGTELDALQYVKNYVTSFRCWEYEVIPLKGKK